MERQLAFRITVLHPPAGVTFRLQRGRGELVPPTEASDERLAFDLTLRIRGDVTSGPPNFLGPLTQGPPASRFVYVNSGTSAGQVDSRWTRRAKVPLTSISWELIEEVLSQPGAVLEARIAGTGKDGGPACATVPLLDGGWNIYR
jgi:hypothetical protein